MSSHNPPLPSDGLREVYEQRAELEYPAPVARPDPRVNRKFERMSELLLGRLPVSSFLDVGTGDGRYLPLLAEVVPVPARIAATDISSRILETARAAAADAGIEPELVRANLESLPFADDSFELVFCTQVIEHLLDPAAGLRELARVLAPGGTLIVSTDSSRNVVTKTLLAPRTALVGLLGLRGRRLRVHFPEAEFAPGELEQLLVATGLTVAELGTFRFTPPPPFGARTQQLLNRIDKQLAPHGLGDIVYALATKP